MNSIIGSYINLSETSLRQQKQDTLTRKTEADIGFPLLHCWFTATFFNVCLRFHMTSVIPYYDVRLEKNRY